MEGFLNNIRVDRTMEESAIRQLSPLILAYVGDAVYEIFVRTLIVTKHNVSVNKLHSKSVNYVKAKAQSDAVHKIIEYLTPEERDIIRRGRNAKSGTLPKHADIDEYRYATGLEALIGFLYLSGKDARLVEILEVCIGMLDNDSISKE